MGGNRVFLSQLIRNGMVVGLQGMLKLLLPKEKGLNSPAFSLTFSGVIFPSTGMP